MAFKAEAESDDQGTNNPNFTGTSIFASVAKVPHTKTLFKSVVPNTLLLKDADCDDPTSIVRGYNEPLTKRTSTTNNTEKKQGYPYFSHRSNIERYFYHIDHQLAK